MSWMVTTLLTGCGGAEYTLHLTPVTVSTQSPFDGLDRIDLVLDPVDGDALRVSLGSASSGETPEVTGLPALDGTRVAVEGYRDGDLVMRGLTAPITASSGVVNADVFVAETETAAWLSPLPEASWLSMLVPLGDGRFWLAGGAGNGRGGDPNKGLDTIYTLNLAPPDGLTFVEAETDLPSYEVDGGGRQSARAGATFTVLTVDGPDVGKILVAGGSESYPFDNGGVATDSASLYDPATDTWEELPASDNMTTARAVHVAVENLLGNVVIYGGFGSDLSLPTNVEFYDRASRKFTRSTTSVDLGVVGVVAADMGQDGTLLCGGTDASPPPTGEAYSTQWTASNGCYQVSIDGTSIDAVESLPVGVAGAAMVTLADGRVLLTGGASTNDDVDNDADAPAVDSAWLFNPGTGTWGTLSSNLNVARAGHRMVLLEDGRVLIVGGAESFNLVYPPANPISCLELYDPANASFTAVDGCTASDDAGGLPGRAYLPSVAYDPDFGVLITGGLGSDSSAQSGVALFVPGM